MELLSSRTKNSIAFESVKADLSRSIWFWMKLSSASKYGEQNEISTLSQRRNAGIECSKRVICLRGLPIMQVPRLKIINRLFYKLLIFKRIFIRFEKIQKKNLRAISRPIRRKGVLPKKFSIIRLNRRPTRSNLASRQRFPLRSISRKTSPHKRTRNFVSYFPLGPMGGLKNVVNFGFKLDCIIF